MIVMANQAKWGIGLLVGGILTWLFVKKASASSEVNLTEKDNGSTVTVRPGTSIVVTLPSNPSTGFGWYAATERYPLGRPEVRTVKPLIDSLTPGLVGAPVIETRTYRITPAMAGSHRVYLEYKRPWEQNVQPSKVFFFDVNVTPS